MMNFINAIPESIGWMMAGGGLVISALVFIDVIRMVVIGIKGRIEERQNKSSCPLCGQKVKPFAEDEESCTYKCPRCRTQWNEER